MQLRGFRLDTDAHHKLIEDLRDERYGVMAEYAKARIDCGHLALAGAPVPATPAERPHPDPPDQSRTRRLGADGEVRRLSTKRSDLRRAAHHPPITALSKLAAIDKLLTSFGDRLAAKVSPVTGRVHASYKVAGTASGRASCSGPNLQQMPRDKRFRALFVADPGNILVVADYSSMELRAAASISGDLAMTAAFVRGDDLHRITAARMSGKDPADATDEERNSAKRVNFGAIYGMGAAGLVKSAWDAYGTVLTPTEATRWLAAFAEAYPIFDRWRREHADRCADRRYIVIGKAAANGIGRRYPLSRLPEGKSSYTVSCNLPVQGACADASMVALAAINDLLFEHDIDGGPVAWLHDEIVLEVPAKNAAKAAELLVKAMLDAFAETFPAPPQRPCRSQFRPELGRCEREESGMSKRFRNKFERSDRDFYATPIQSVAPSVSHLQAAGRRVPRDAAGRFSSARRKD